MNALTRHLITLALAVLACATFALPLAAQDAPAADEPAPPADSAPSAADLEQRVRVLLSGYDYFPTREDLDAVAPAVPAILVAIYNDPESRPTTKGRCIDALGYYGDDETARQFLEYIIANADSDEIPSGHVHKALTSYTKAFGDQAIEVVAPFLEHRDEQLRITASVAIAKSTGRAGKELVRARLQLEKNDVARERIQQALDFELR